MADEATHYVPIIPAVLTSWAEGIRDGHLTSAEPTNAMFGNIMSAKYEDRIAQSGRGGLKGSSGGIVNNISLPPPSPAPVAPVPPCLVTSTSSGKQYSSPVRMPSDPIELSDLEMLDTFFG